MMNIKLHVGKKAVLRKVVVLCIALLLIAAIAGSGQLRPAITADNVQTQVFFSPRGGCTEAVVSTISQAKTEILVQAYSFTSAPIAKALVDAHKRGVHVQIILDRSQRKERYSSADFTAHAGIPTYIDAAHAIAHNKVMIIDKSTVISGSFNFTKAAEEKNAENLLVLRSKELARGYIENWQWHKEHSESYKGR
jgi:phosphatidylserine/phosphatidylglycerophosphate/cardiolipin synthase-like enzyme